MMTVFVCIDDRGGMLFNKRRQSRDSRVIEDVIRTADDGVLYISDFSEILFEESDASVISVPEPLESAGDGSFVFIENKHLGDYLDRIDRLIIYKWNRKYPSDFSLDVDPVAAGFKKKSTREFKGTSHDKITREDYVK
jgi:hypothetical protein